MFVCKLDMVTCKSNAKQSVSGNVFVSGEIYLVRRNLESMSTSEVLAHECTIQTLAFPISVPKIDCGSFREHRLFARPFETRRTSFRAMKTITSRSRISTQTRKASRARNGNGSGNTETRIRPSIAAWLKKPKQNLIGGEWSPAASGKLFDVFNPADASVIARVPDSDKKTSIAR